MNEHRNDNQPDYRQAQEAEEQLAWWELNHKLLEGFDELRPVIQGEKSFEHFEGNKNVGEV